MDTVDVMDPAEGPDAGSSRNRGEPARPSCVEWVAVAACIATGTFLRCLQLGEESIWGDESFSLRMTGLSFGGIIEACAPDAHPPLYFMLLKVWCSIFPRDLVGLRSFSVVASVLFLPLFWMLARRLLSSGGAMLALVFMTLSPYQLMYAQEGRMYAFMCLLLAVMALCMLPLVLEPERRTGRAWRVAFLFLTGGVMVFTHFFFIFPAAWISMLAMVRLWWNPLDRRRGIILLAGWWLWIAALAAVYLSQMINKDLGWVPPLTAGTFRGIINAFAYGTSIPPRPAWIIFPLATGLFLLLSAAFLKPRDCAERRDLISPRTVLALLLFTQVGLPILISLYRPIIYYGERYLILGTLPVYLLLGLGLERLRERRLLWTGILCSAVLLAGMIRYHLDYFDSRQKRPYDAAAAVLDAAHQPGDLVVVSPFYTVANLNYYLKRPYEILSGDDPASVAVLQGRHGVRVWFISFGMQPLPLESVVIPNSRRLRNEVHELDDMPALKLRLTQYQLD